MKGIKKRRKVNGVLVCVMNVRLREDNVKTESCYKGSLFQGDRL